MSTVKFNDALGCIECSGCAQRTPLSRATLRDPERFAETMSMARHLHADCANLNTQYEAELSRRWREVVLTERYRQRPAREYGITF